MLAGAVYPVKGLLMQEAGVSALIRYLLHYLHGKLVMVYRYVCGLEYGSQLMLRRSDLVVLCFCGYPQLPKLLIKLMHEFGYFWLKHSEIVILHLLSLWRGGSDKGSSAHHEILSFQIFFLVYEEIFLLRAYSGIYPLYILSEKLQYLYGGF